MPATKTTVAAKTTAAKTTPQERAAHGKAALDGLEISLDEAQKAITELRRDLSTGRRQLVKDVEAAIKSARRDLNKTRKAIQGDLSELGEALTPRRTASDKPAAKAAAEPQAKAR
jgi:hypothetical protein